VAATTEEANLPKPLLSRFVYRLELSPLDDDTMAILVSQIARRHEIDADESIIQAIVRASHGIPRTAQGLMRIAIDRAKSMKRSSIDVQDIRAALDAKGLDEEGLCRVQRQILSVLRSSPTPMGIECLAAVIEKPIDAVLKIYEPDLLRCGYVVRTPRGRVARRPKTDIGASHDAGKSKPARLLQLPQR
jgi:Holliday junction DNA helicase RuvB